MKFLLTLVIAITLTSPVVQAQQSKIVYTSEMKKVLTATENAGYIKFKPSGREIWVDPSFWNSTNYDQKNSLGYLGAVKFAHDLNSDLYYCTIINNRTGKRLAKWSRSWGFKID
jgi:hypothetical protein